jgi:hypothetical protein
VLAFAICAVLALIYAFAGVGKLKHLSSFELYIAPVMSRSAGRAARAAISVEGGLALLLAVAAPLDGIRAWAGAVSAAFVVVATAIYGALLVAGEDGSCRCFGGPSRDLVQEEWQPSLLTARNWALVVLSIIIVPGSTAEAAFLAGAVIAALVATALITGIVVLKRSNAGRERHLAALGHGRDVRVLQAHTWWLNGRPRPF